MKYNPTARSFDCAPTLDDSEVLAFCRDGHLLLPGVVAEEINRRVCDWLDGKVPATPSYLPEGLTQAELERIRGTHEPSGILLEEWFLEHVLLNPRLAGVMRSLLGPDIGLPVLVSHLGLYFAGLDTSATVCSFMLHALLTHPELHARIALETLRMYPIIPATPRVVANAFEFGGRLRVGDHLVLGLRRHCVPDRGQTERPVWAPPIPRARHGDLYRRLRPGSSRLEAAVDDEVRAALPATGPDGAAMADLLLDALRGSLAGAVDDVFTAPATGAALAFCAALFFRHR